ncbi:MAG: hypothetical protein AAGJ28_03800 [Pseudomonadota bacterium]
MAKRPTRTTTPRAKTTKTAKAAASKTATARKTASKTTKSAAAKSTGTAKTTAKTAAKSAFKSASKSAVKSTTQKKTAANRTSANRTTAKSGTAKANAPVQVASDSALSAARARAALATGSLPAGATSGLFIAERTLAIDPADLTPVGGPPKLDIPDSALPVHLRPDASEYAYIVGVSRIKVAMPDAKITASTTNDLQASVYYLPRITFNFDDFDFQAPGDDNQKIASLIYAFDDAVAGQVASRHWLGHVLIAGQPMERMTPMLDMLREGRPSCTLRFASDGDEIELLSSELEVGISFD